MNYKFVDAVDLNKTKYSFKMSHISETDVRKLNFILGKMSAGFKMNESTVYVNNRGAKFFTNEFPGNPIQFIEGVKWMVKVIIQGFKIGEGGRLSLVWKLNQAKMQK